MSAFLLGRRTSHGGFAAALTPAVPHRLVLSVFAVVFFLRPLLSPASTQPRPRFIQPWREVVEVEEVRGGAGRAVLANEFVASECSPLSSPAAARRLAAARPRPWPAGWRPPAPDRGPPVGMGSQMGGPCVRVMLPARRVRAESADPRRTPPPFSSFLCHRPVDRRRRRPAVRLPGCRDSRHRRRHRHRRRRRRVRDSGHPPLRPPG